MSEKRQWGGVELLRLWSNPVYTVCILGGPQPYTYEVSNGHLRKREEP